MLIERCAVGLGAICVFIAAGCSPTAFTFEEEKSASSSSGAGGSSSTASSSSNTSSSSSSGAGGSGPAAVCGDGVITSPEVCDDGNALNGDTCAASCRCGDVAGMPVSAFSSPDGHCYFIYTALVSWSDAKAYCEARGATLAKTTSAAELDMISPNSPGMQVLWLGGEDVAVESQWRWIDGTPWSIFPCDDMMPGCDNTVNLWAIGEPNNMDDEDCLSMNPMTSRLNDLACTYISYGLCEIGTP